MKTKIILSLAIAGTVLVWLPILAPVFFSVAGFFNRPVFRFRFDFLMPAELFPLVLVGGVLVLWAALSSRRLRALTGWGLASAVVLLVGSQVLAGFTGLASGRIEPGGWQSALVLVMLTGYILAVIIVGVGGALLVRNLYLQMKKPKGG